MNVYAGPERVITRVTLRLVPLTPIHIGDGTEWRPDEYLIEDGRAAYDDESTDEPGSAAAHAPATLCRFDQQAAMRAMTPTQRTAFATALDRGKLVEAAKVLRAAGRSDILERIPLSAASRSDLARAMEEPLRAGAVKPFIRSGGRPYIPGSSIKGAFRTALASAALPRGSRDDARWTHDFALTDAFGLEQGKTETDPLRFLSVSDAALPDGATLVDKAEVMKRGGAAPSGAKGGGGIQMHYERTRSLSEDPQLAPAFSVTLAVDGRAAGPDGVRRPEARFDLWRALRVTRDFHVKLFNTEAKTFFEGPTKALLTQRLQGHSGPGKEPPFTQAGWTPGFLLLRLGRFGHFESKSLEGVRRGQFLQARNPADKIRPPNAWGVTRTVTRDTKGNPIPFGWVIGWVAKEERPPC
ncbi:MAG: RAMP superfamily CRISPR-associated protein [Acetobacteraceae bacterium]|nr:RAMP superfamily CRISPR-associated protein [Rhodovarius sp.]MDW8397844.1 RAMP superfamily CRISPR-associated protein [Acetobacteraceae bacterium]